VQLVSAELVAVDEGREVFMELWGHCCPVHWVISNDLLNCLNVDFEGKTNLQDKRERLRGSLKYSAFTF
jgi:hypothetical protein